MLRFPSGWIQQFGVNLVTAYPPDRPGMRFRYHERIRPQPRFSSVVRRMLAADPAFQVHRVGEMLRTVTREGEYGAWVAIEGRRQGPLEESSVMRFIGAVFMDEFATALDCVVHEPAHFREAELTSRELLHSETLKMTRRPRPFFYVPPVGWQGVPSSTTANWYPLDFPGNLSNISVPPATFLDDSTERGRQRAIESALAQVGEGLEVESESRDQLTAACGVSGACLRLHGARAGKPMYRELAMFVVAPYAYRMRLETGMASQVLDLREVFRGVAGSFRPLPGAEEIRLGRAFVEPSNPFAHWAN